MSHFLKKPVVYHTLFWVCYFSFNVVRWGSYFNDYVYSFQSNLIGFPIHMALSYFHVYVLLPQFIIKKKYFAYLLLLFSSLMLMMFVKVAMTDHFLLPVWPEAGERGEQYSINHILAVTIGELYVIGITTSLKLTKDWIRNQRKTQELEKQNMVTELSFLKAQIHPHFLFNTLNNLYSLTLTKSPQAPDTVLKLSELMSYMLYQKEQKVSLQEEIKYIQHYLDLERLRFGNRLDLHLALSGKIEGKRIPPLIFVPYLENVFKHGVNNRLEVIHVDVIIHADDDYIHLEVRNPLPEMIENQKTVFKLQKHSGGTGLKHARRRLELLYGNRYDLQITQDDSTYQVKLSIPAHED